MQNTIGGSRFGTLKARTGKTQFIVDDKGYLLNSVGKLKNAFTTQVPVYAKSSARWPQVGARRGDVNGHACSCAIPSAIPSARPLSW